MSIHESESLRLDRNRVHGSWFVRTCKKAQCLCVLSSRSVCVSITLCMLCCCMVDSHKSLKVHDRSLRSFRLFVQSSSDIAYHASGVDLPRADTLILSREFLHRSHFFEFRDHSRVRRKRAVFTIKRERSVDSRFTSDKPSLLTAVATSKPGSSSTNYQILEQQKGRLRANCNEIIHED